MWVTDAHHAASAEPPAFTLCSRSRQWGWKCLGLGLCSNALYPCSVFQSAHTAGAACCFSVRQVTSLTLQRVASNLATSPPKVRRQSHSMHAPQHGHLPRCVLLCRAAGADSPCRARSCSWATQARPCAPCALRWPQPGAASESGLEAAGGGGGGAPGQRQQRQTRWRGWGARAGIVLHSWGPSQHQTTQALAWP